MTNRFPLLPAALQYAATLHAADVRKGADIPYISHLLAVAALVMENGGDQDTAIAALLHDALEDAKDPAEAKRRMAEIEQQFGGAVLAIVEGCTDGLPDEQGTKPPWKERKQKYLAHLATCTPDTLLVSCCDKLHNASAVLRDYREIGGRLWTRFNGGREGAIWYYRSLVNTFELIRQFRQSPPAALVAELDRVVTQIEQLYGVVKLREAGGYPKPVASRETDDSVTEIGSAEGMLGKDRPYRADGWSQDGITAVTVMFSSLGLEDWTASRIGQLLEEEQLVQFETPSPYFSAQKTFDESDNPVWSVNIVIADADNIFARDNFALKR